MTKPFTAQELVDRMEGLAGSGRFRWEAYDFVMRGLDHTIQDVAREDGKPRHVRGAELVDGIRSLAQDEFGPMAKHVLNTWGIYDTRDIGEIVFELVETEILRKTEDDCIEDFENQFDFEDVFERDYYRDRPILQE